MARPYCLFSAYFSNIYFGLRQCVEIDSLRFAIDHLEDEDERSWALGALVATLSYLGNTYGGHFAQPRFRKVKDINLREFVNLLERRVQSVFHEFAVRLENLARESWTSKEIEVVPGPWQRSLEHAEALLTGGEVVVYLDAPYKRDEYSRYYHVLETLIKYDYPHSEGVGRVPKKEPGERFKSEFFTRDVAQIEAVLSDIFCSVLEKGWSCAWSYSDSGDATIVSVIEDVASETNCIVKSYCTPYTHKAQGGKRSKKVREYLLIFRPR